MIRRRAQYSTGPLIGPIRKESPIGFAVTQPSPALRGSYELRAWLVTRLQAKAIRHSLRGADSLKLYGLVMVGLKTFITNKTNWGLRWGIRFPLEGELLAAVMTRNAEIPAIFDPLNEHWGIESNTDIDIAGARPSECRMKRFKSASAVTLQRSF